MKKTIIIVIIALIAVAVIYFTMTDAGKKEVLWHKIAKKWNIPKHKIREVRLRNSYQSIEELEELLLNGPG